VVKIVTKADWQIFEISQWRDAVHDRGLKLESLDVEQQKLVAEAISVVSSAAALKALGKPLETPASLLSPPASEEPGTSRG